MRAVGVDTIIREADVARATLYANYGSKDQLVAAYLHQRSASWFDGLDVALDGLPDARARILRVFELLGEWFDDTGFRGCPCSNARSEGAEPGVIADAVDTHRRRLHELMRDLAAGTDTADPDALARALVLVYDGAITNALLDGRAGTGETARAIAAAVHDAALLPRPDSDRR